MNREVHYKLFPRNLIRIIAILVIVPFSISLQSQQPLNLGFEKLSVEGAARPWGWEFDSYSTSQVLLDSLTKRTGKYSLSFQRKEDIKTDDTLVMRYAIEGYELSNKQIEIRGWIKTRELSGTAFCKLSYYRGDEEKKSISQQLNGTAGWKQVSVRMNIPADTKFANIDLCQNGVGKTWFDDLSLYINGKLVREVQIAAPFSKEQLKWLNDHTSPLYSFDAGTKEKPTSFKDLTPLKIAAADARIIALGEATHGTSEFFRMKHRVLEFAVKELGVRVFAIEDNQLVVERVNRYVLGGQGTARNSMAGMFSVWQTREVHNLIQWVRNYNDAHPEDMVEFVGFDMQNLKQPIDSLFSFLKKRDTALYNSVSKNLSDLKQNGPNSYNASDSSKKEWFYHAQRTLNEFSDRKQQWLSKAANAKDSTEIEWGFQYANLVKQYAQNALLGHLSFYRDTAMAENISWILSRRKPGTKMLIWAHDYHISRGEDPIKEHNIYNGISMGSHLAKKYGSAYKALSLSTYSGEYWAQISYMNFKQLSCPLLPGPKGSLDEALHQITTNKKFPGLFLNLQDAKKLSWFQQLIPMRFANHVNIEYGYWTRYSIPYQFDGIIFIDKTSAADSYSK
jgi:erythromycin esterase